MSTPGLAFAFAAGLVASLNPCGFAMLPAFVGYYVGVPEGQGALSRRVLDGVAVGAVVTAGLAATFALVGLAVSYAGSAFLSRSPLPVFVVGTGLVGLGSWLLAGRPLSLPIGSPSRAGTGRGLASAAAYGVAYALVSVSCTLPVFLVVVGSAFAEGSIGGGLALFVAYALGMGSVIVAVSLGAAVFQGIVARWLRRAMPLVHRISGALLIAAGTYLVGRELRLGREHDGGLLGWVYAHPQQVLLALVWATVLATSTFWLRAPPGKRERAATDPEPACRPSP